jgi:hypothetical protein
MQLAKMTSGTSAPSGDKLMSRIVIIDVIWKF